MYIIVTFVIKTDTAAVYKNESLIRDVLAQVCPDNGVTLEEIYVTSKVGKCYSYLCAYEEDFRAWPLLKWVWPCKLTCSLILLLGNIEHASTQSCD